MEQKFLLISSLESNLLGSFEGLDIKHLILKHSYLALKKGAINFCVRMEHSKGVKEVEAATVDSC